ncbi:MAG: hypothetical protein ACRCYX_10620 [Dermatophilaceae bacterium]
MAQVAEKGTGRLTATRNHDEAFDGMQARLALIDEGVVPVDVVSVWRRGGQLLCANELDRNSGRWVAPAVAARALSDERRRIWTYPEGATFLAALNQVRQEMPHGLLEQVRETRRLADNLLPLGAADYAVAQAVSPGLARPHQRGATAVARRIARPPTDREVTGVTPER